MMRIYRLLLLLYPAAFRAEYGNEMAAIFQMRMRDARGAAKLALWFDDVLEVIMNAPAVHWDMLKQDLRDTARTLRRARGFALAVVLVTALGVGANTAAFSVADFVLFRPLPFPDAHSLVRLCEGPRMGGGWGCMNELSPANYRDLKQMSVSLDALGAFTADAVNLVGGGEPRRLAATRVTSEVLPLLGVRPLMGRVAEAGDADRDAVVISHSLWQSQFGGSPGVLGTRVHLDGAPFTIIGVMPRGFYFPTRDVQLWTPLTLQSEDYASRTDTYIEGVGLLAQGFTFEQSRSEFVMLAERLSQQYPDTNADTGVSFFRLHDTMSPRFRLMLLSLSGASLCLLLLACASVANLMLARATAQEREMAVRAALGASRDRLVRQLSVQSVVLAVLGGAIGVGIATLTVPLFSSLVPPTMPLDLEPALDVRMLAMAALFTALTAMAFGVLPAMRAGRTGFAALREGARAGSGHKARMRAMLVAVQVTVSVVILITAGLLTRAVWRVQTIEPGFRSEHVLTLRTALPRPRYDDPVDRTAFYTRVLADVRALPGVEHAGFTNGLPLVVTGLVTGIELPGQDPQKARNDGISHRWITPGYLGAMGIPLLRGRDVEDGDLASRPWVAVISASLGERYWPGEDPIGKTFRHRGQMRTVVGIAGDVRVRGLERTSEPQMYLPAEQIASGAPDNFDPKDLVIRHIGQDAARVPAIRQIVRAADPEQPISDVRALQDVLAGETASRRAQLQVLGVLACVAVLLSGVGIYGLLAYTVAQRHQEIGVRLALGAEPAGIGRMIFADGVRLGLIAIVPGMIVAYVAARGMRALLFGVAPGDPATFVAVAAVVLAITCAGAGIPAIRAMRVPPMTAIKGD